jgi:hypothetical protein
MSRTDALCYLVNDLCDEVHGVVVAGTDALCYLVNDLCDEVHGVVVAGTDALWHVLHVPRMEREDVNHLKLIILNTAKNFSLSFRLINMSFLRKINYKTKHSDQRTK